MSAQEEREMLSNIKEAMAHLPYSSGAKKTGSEMENLIQWMISPEEILNNLDHLLRGEVPGEKLGQWVKLGQQMLNDIGVRKMMTIVTARVNKIIIMSNLTEKEIYNIVYYIAEDVRTELFEMCEYYEVEYHNLSTICGMVNDFCFAAIKQAQDGGARRIWSAIQRVTTSIIRDETKKKGWLPGVDLTSGGQAQ